MCLFSDHLNCGCPDPRDLGGEEPVHSLSDLLHLWSRRGVFSKPVLPLSPGRGCSECPEPIPGMKGFRLASFFACRVALPCALPPPILLPTLDRSIFAGASLLFSRVSVIPEKQCRGYHRVPP